MIRPNAPKMITLLAAIALTIVGISVTLHPIGFVHDALKSVDIKLTQDQGHWCLIASPLLLVAGSLLRGL